MLGLTVVVLFLSLPYHAFGNVDQVLAKSVALAEPDIFHLFWEVDGSEIIFEFHAKTQGWLGFGISGSGGMRDSDIVTGWVKDGKGYIQDRYALVNGIPPPVDTAGQDWTLLSASENDTHTVMRMRRPLTLCDPEDRSITEDTLRVIWALNDEDPSDADSLMYHTARGTRSLFLLIDMPPPIKRPDDAFSVDVVVNNALVPSDDTTYYCMGFQLPTLSGKHHIVEIEPVVTPGNEGVVHHLVMTGCYGNLSHWHNYEFDCTSGTDREIPMPELEGCLTQVYIWAVGGGKLYYPEHLGFSMGLPEDVTFLKMELHYDNPLKVADIRDSSGIRMWLTPSTREYDVGVMTIGQTTTRAQIIPPKQKEFTTLGICPQECISAAIEPVNEVKVIGVMLHTHLIGVKVKVRHIRKGVEQPPLAQDNSYDFNFQEYHFNKEDTIIKPGDDIIVECTYNSMGRNNVTFGGQATTDEMCLAFLVYYPAVDLQLCLSTPRNNDILSNMGYEKTRELGYLPEVVANELDWEDKEVVRRYQQELKKSLNRADCFGFESGYASSTYKVPKIYSEHVAQGPCEQEEEEEPETDGGFALRAAPACLAVVIVMLIAI